ncbi:hypothetical protein AX16_007424 [Volvariella volvacea WC 439]|nr:hypothetical protein AX16_007424 [Volvariella volvacea WC 439]
MPSAESDWEEIDIKLVGNHPLWGHYLWNAARAFATYLDHHPEFYVGRHVLELGAGGGLPGIVTAKNGAKAVVLTDYPDNSLIQNLKENVETNIPNSTKSNVWVEGFIWGQPAAPLLNLLDYSREAQEAASASDRDTNSRPHVPAFDLIILSDLIFNHSQHEALLKTCEHTLRRTTALPSGPDAEIGAATNEVIPVEAEIAAPESKPPSKPSSHQTSSSIEPSVLVFYTHHRPHLAHRDMEFFDKARQRGWKCEKVLERTFPPMFPDDPGEESVRATVHGWRLTREL